MGNLSVATPSKNNDPLTLRQSPTANNSSVRGLYGHISFYTHINVSRIKKVTVKTKAWQELNYEKKRGLRTRLSGRCLLCKLEVLGLVPSTTEGSLAMMLLREKRQYTGVVALRDSALNDTRAHWTVSGTDTISHCRCKIGKHTQRHGDPGEPRNGEVLEMDACNTEREEYLRFSRISKGTKTSS